MIAASPVVAQQTAVTTAPTPAAVDTSGDVVVTAQKREESVRKVPISLAVLSGAALDQQASGGTLEALAAVPAISQSQSDAGGMTQVSIRGVSPAVTFGNGSTTVGYYIDSIPFSQVRSAEVPNTNDFDLSRIEVLRGPQGTLYGASSLNGVVRILTNDADPSRFDAKARAGVSGTEGGDVSYRGDAAINIPLIQDKLAIRLVGGYERLGGWVDQPVLGRTNANRTTVESLRIKVAARPLDNLRIDLEAWLARNHYDAADYADAAGNQYNLQPAPGTTKYGAYNARIAYDLPFMSITSSTSKINFRQQLLTDASYVALDFAKPNPNLFLLNSDLPAHVLSEELLLNSRGAGPWRWSIGGFYRDASDDRAQTLPLVLGNKVLSWSDRSLSYAFFGQLTRTFADDRFELSGGLRYFHDRTDTVTLVPLNGLLPAGTSTVVVHAVTPRVVATWLPSPALTVYASYSQGFRSGVPQTPLVLLQAPGLAPAKSDTLNNYEIGAKGSLLGGFATYEAAFYFIKWNDVQVGLSLQINGAYIGGTINGTSASGFGTDLSLTLHPAPRLQIGGAVSVNDLTEDADVVSGGVVLYPKGSRLPFSPKTTGTVFASYGFALGERLDATVKVSGNYRSQEVLRLLATDAVAGYCQVYDPVTRNSICRSGSPVFVNATLDIANHSNQRLSLYVQNLNNYGGLLIPASGGNTSFRPRPRTFGIQFETKF